MTELENKRKHKRLTESLRVKVYPSSGTLVTEGHTRDISEGGMGLVLTRQPLSGGSVRVVFKMDEPKHSFDLKGTIRWCMQASSSGGLFESGIEFRRISDEDKQAIKEFVEKNSTSK